MLSAIGNDNLGKSALDLLNCWNIKTDFVSVSQTNETGKCVVTLDSRGIPNHNLLDAVAYDCITRPDFLNENFDAFYFGSLALRHSMNRETVPEIIKNNSFKKIFVDINIRKPFVSEEAVKLAYSNATIIKISDEELPVVTNLLFKTEYDYIEASKVIGEKFNNIKIVIITLGEKSSFAYDCRKNITYSCGFEKIKVVSTVGAGDSFSATFLNKYLSGFDIEECLKLASKVEAIPDYISCTF